jgi:uncharacterized repeat protein (TIGR02543 family)
MASLLSLTCKNPVQWNGDVQEFIEDGLSRLSLLNYVFNSDDRSVDYIPSAEETVIRVNMINPKDLTAEFTLRPENGDLYVSPPELTIIDNDTLLFSLNPIPAAEHRTLTLTLNIYVPTLNRTYPPETLSIQCETAPNPVNDLIGGTADNDKAVIAFRLPDSETDDDLKSVEITWGIPESGNTVTNIFDTDDQSLMTAPAGGDYLPEPGPLNRYFSPSAAVTGSIYAFTVILIDEAGIRSEARSTASHLVEYRLTYNPNNADSGTVPAPVTYTYGETAVVSDNIGNLQRTGYVFGGWNTQADGTGIIYNADDTIVMTLGDVELYAIWTDQEYILNYNANNADSGTVPAPVTYTYGETAVVSDNIGNLQRTGYVFGGWNTRADGTGTTYTLDDTIVITTGDVILYALWTNLEYTLTYNPNGAGSGTVPEEVSFTYGETAVISGNTGSLVRNGYIFGGWNTRADGTGIGYSEGNTIEMISGDIVLYAVWIEETYSLVYNSNGAESGTIPATITYTFGETAVVQGNTGNLQREGSTFGGWNTSADGTGTGYTENDEIIMNTGIVILYAVWVSIEYDLSYNGNGAGSGTVPASVTCPYGETAAVSGNSGNLEREGYAFIGWNTRADGTGASHNENDEIVMISGDVVLYAVWYELAGLVVTFDFSGTGGNTLVFDPPELSVTVNTPFSLTPAESDLRNGGTSWNWSVNGLLQEGETGSTFTGTPDSTGQYIIGCTVTYNNIVYSGSMKLTAINELTVSYSANGAVWGNVPVDGSRYVTGAQATVLDNIGELDRPGFDFSGWNTAADGGGTFYAPGSTIIMGSSSVILYARWLDTPPSEVTGLTAEGGDGKVTLTWTDPADEDFDHTVVTWDGGSVTVGKGTAGAVITGLTNGRTYTFTITTYDSDTDGSVMISSDGISVSQFPSLYGNTDNPAVGGLSLNMIYVPAKTIPAGLDDSGTAEIGSGFWMLESEVWGDLWNTVYMWATNSAGYSFTNTGAGLNQIPANSMSWKDAVVWCNALTEYYNENNGTEPDLSFVYCIDSSYLAPVRDASFVNITDPIANPDADGFRLPDPDEWELAARYIGDFNGDGDIRDSGEYYPGDHASGADGDYDDTPDVDLDSDGDMDATDDVAVNDAGGPSVIKSKHSNTLGLYDMSGNVREFVFNPGEDGSNGLAGMGSGFNGTDDIDFSLGVRRDDPDRYNRLSTDTGFRFVRNGEALP